MSTHALSAAAAALVLAVACVAQAATWEEAQAIKVEQLKRAAAHAVEQQRIESFPPQPLEATFTGVGNVTVEPSKDWDADGDGACLKVTVRDIPVNHDHVRIADRLAIRFGKPTNLLEKATGMAFWIKAPEGLSKDLRFGAHFKCAGSDQDPVIISDTPVVDKFGDDPHVVYLDWGFAFAHDVRPLHGTPKGLLTKVEAVELTFVQKRLPAEPVKLEPVSGTFYIDGVQLVDFYDGSYDNERFPKNGPINAHEPIVPQGRTQQVAVICALFGGEAGAKSAVRAMDMLARIQCWDGSWPEMQTRLQGEFTHGMILADAARALAELRRQKRPELAEKVLIRHWSMPRDALYEQMIYRAAMSRAPGPIHVWRDTYCSGTGSLETGCNRPMIFVASQYIAAQAITDEARRKSVLAEYEKNMGDIVAWQGKTAGGWPIFGEGDRYQGKGLHWDCGYTTDHVFIMSLASRATGDPRWGEMMKKFDTVVEAMMLPDGLHIDGALSERGNAKQGGLKAPDLVYQEALRHGATALAQWAANASHKVWADWPRGGSLWPSCSSFRGYALGAFLTWQTFDMAAEPEPKDLGHVFPRQWPVWTAKWMDKEGREVRRSKLIVQPDGRMVNTFAWEVGQYPVITGVPIAPWVYVGGPVELEPVSLTGSMAKVPEKPKVDIRMSSDGGINGVVQYAELDLSTDPTASHDGADEDSGISISTLTTITIDVEGGVRIVFRARPTETGKTSRLGFRILRQPAEVKHVFAKE